MKERVEILLADLRSELAYWENVIAYTEEDANSISDKKVNLHYLIGRLKLILES